MNQPHQTRQSSREITHDLEAAISLLKQELNAVILAHYYQDSEIQDLADMVGDSLELSRRAASTDADVIVFAGVHFMAETAKILSPEKKVLLPDLSAGCSLAEGCPPDAFREFLGSHPGHTVISYINCSAEVKAMSDIICTSSNAEKLIRQIPIATPIIFAPDRNLGRYLIRTTGRDMVLWQGSCVVHETFSERKILHLRTLYPGAELIAHPECEESILEQAHFIGSTSKLLAYVQSCPAPEFIVATEAGIIHQMQKAAPSKLFLPAPPEENCACNQCPYMKLNTMEKLYRCMRDGKPEIVIAEDIRKRALAPLKRMLEMSI